jgi:hypothetical protein
MARILFGDNKTRVLFWLWPELREVVSSREDRVAAFQEAHGIRSRAGVFFVLTSVNFL